MSRYHFAFLLSMITLLATYSLIVLGGVVHNTGSSLACPDWPLCFGEWFPEMTGGVLYEHSHRLLGATVGLCAILLNIVLWRPAPGWPPLRGWALGLLGLIIYQGVLGGLTVIYKLPTMISTAHLATSMLVLLTLVMLARATWLRASGPPEVALMHPSGSARGERATGILVTALVLLFAQIILGAFLRHTGASGAAGIGPEASLIGIDPLTGEHSLWPGYPAARLNVFHRYFAVVVIVVIALACSRAWMMLDRVTAAQAHGRRPRWAWLIWGPLVLACFQASLGVGVLAMRLAISMLTLHLAVAALLLANLFLVTVLMRSLPAAQSAAANAGEAPPLRPGIAPLGPPPRPTGQG